MFADRESYSADNCSVKRALEVVGEKWTLLVLISAGVMRCEPYRNPGQRERHEYRLTDKGRDLMPVVVALMQWGDRWEADPEGPPVEITHRGCGHPVEQVLRCRHDHVELNPRDTEPRPGPGARPARSA